MTDMWDLVAAERAALASDLDGLSAGQWDTDSLCDGWTVRQTLAHMTSTARTSPGGFFAGLIGSGFNFGRFVEKGIERQSGDSPEQTLANFRAIERSRTAPPGPKASWLGETVIHAEDIRRPLGIAHEYDADAVRQCLDFFKGSNTLIGTKKRLDGLALSATDQDWSHGTGAPVEGRAIDLLMAATGRGVGCESLAGEGVQTLRSRC